MTLITSFFRSPGYTAMSLKNSILDPHIRVHAMLDIRGIEDQQLDHHRTRGPFIFIFFSISGTKSHVHVEE